MSRYLVCFLTLTIAVVSNALECYHCYSASDAGLCRNHVTCEKDELCAVEAFGNYYNLGCAAEQICENRRAMVAPPSVLGRRRAEAHVHCCDTDLCNTDFDNMNSTGIGHMATATHGVGFNTTIYHTTMINGITNVTTSIMPTEMATAQTLPVVSPSCFDHPDCTEIARFDHACLDNTIATTVCPRSCGRCCEDENRDCAVLIKGLEICKTHPDFALRKCRLSCNMCNETLHVGPDTTTASQTSAMTNTIYIPNPTTTFTGSHMSGNTTKGSTQVFPNTFTGSQMSGNTTKGSTQVFLNATVSQTPASKTTPFRLTNTTTLDTTVQVTATVEHTKPVCTKTDHNDCKVLLQSGIGICNKNSTRQLCPHGCRDCIMPISAAQATTTSAPTTIALLKSTTTRTTGVIVVG